MTRKFRYPLLYLHCKSPFWTLRKGESINELFCDVEESPPPFFHINSILISFTEGSFFDLVHVGCIFCVFSIASIVYLESDKKFSVRTLPCLYHTRVYISLLASMLDSIVYQFISDEDKTSPPWMGDVVHIKNTSHKISDNFGLTMINSKIDMTCNFVFVF